MIETITSFLISYSVELGCSGAFMAAFGTYIFFKSKGNNSSEFKVQYCDVSQVIRQYKKLDKRMSESISGGNKNDKFFS